MAAKQDVRLPDLEAQVWCCAWRAAPAAQHVDEFCWRICGSSTLSADTAAVIDASPYQDSSSIGASASAMALASLADTLQRLRCLLQIVPPPREAADSVAGELQELQRWLAAREQLGDEERLSPAECEQLSRWDTIGGAKGTPWAREAAGRCGGPADAPLLLHLKFLPNALLCRMAIDHSRLLQSYAASVPAACDALTSAQTVALQLQALAAASFALALMQLCLAAQQPGSLLYRLASNATLALFTGGAISTQRFLQLAQPVGCGVATPVSVSLLARSAIMQYPPLGSLTATLGKAADGQQLLQLYGRAIVATPAAAEWLASAADGMRAACQLGEPGSPSQGTPCTAVVALLCFGAVEPGGQSTIWAAVCCLCCSMLPSACTLTCFKPLGCAMCLPAWQPVAAMLQCLMAS